MILYFSGTGNSKYVAQKIGEQLQDEALDLFERIRSGDFSALSSERPWIIAAPTYAWQLPHIVRDWVKRTELRGSREVYFVLTCGGSIGNAGAHCKALCARKDMNYRGCLEIVMPENYIALFRAPGKEDSLEIIRRAAGGIAVAAQCVREGKAFPEKPVTLKDKLNSGPVNDLFYPAFVHAKKFHATESCISCGKCERVCPLSNIRLESGRPVWGKNCTHCMACICRCPSEAIEYGSHTQGLLRYTFPE